MRWGCCGDLERLQATDTAGYDYMESPVRVLGLDGPDSDADPYLDAVRTSRIDTEAFNVFVPGSLPIIGPDTDETALQDHVQTIVRRASELPVKVIVLGSGGARKIPHGWDPVQARSQFVSFCHQAADIVGPAGITIVIEPLSASGCNYIHTVAEAHDIAREVDRPEIAILADLYHMTGNDDSIDRLPEMVPHLRHVHLPVPNIPGLIEHELDFDFKAYLAALKGSGYNGRISVEDNGKRFGSFEKEAAPVLDLLKDIWESV